MSFISMARNKEFQLIHTYFQQQAESTAFRDQDVILGIGDDCAIIQPSHNKPMLISVDTSIAGRHFPADANPYDIALRALNVSLSDLAAMGAQARWFTLALTLPDVNEQWLEQFSSGLFAAANTADVSLIGGDTTQGHLSISIQVHGEMMHKKALTRSGAKVGDYLYVSGPLGDAGAGLHQYQQGQRDINNTLLAAYLRPKPELALGQAIVAQANSCIDISDGLLADLSHMLRASAVGAAIDLNKIPLSRELLEAYGRDRALEYALCAGDDYRLLFSSSLPPEALLFDDLDDYAIACIGAIVTGNKCELLHKPTSLNIKTAGFDHFYDNNRHDR